MDMGMKLKMGMSTKDSMSKKIKPTDMVPKYRGMHKGMGTKKMMRK